MVAQFKYGQDTLPSQTVNRLIVTVHIVGDFLYGHDLAAKGGYRLGLSLTLGLSFRWSAPFHSLTSRAGAHRASEASAPQLAVEKVIDRREHRRP